MQGQTQSHFLDIYRSMARAANDALTASLQSTERIHQKQLEIVRSALEQNTRAARQLTEVKSVDELVSTQSEMLGTQFAQTLELWRSSYRAIGEAHTTWLSQMQTHVGQATEAVRQSYDLTKKATEDATRTVASHVTAASREGNGSGSGSGIPERRPPGTEHGGQQHAQRKS